MSNESISLENKCDFFRWQPAAWLRVSGEDAETFLQGQFTNDLRTLASDRGVYGLWLNHKGRVIGDSFVLRGASAEFWVGSYFCPAAVIKERLEAFIIADDVTVEDVTDQWRAVTLFGVTAESQSANPALGCWFAGRRGLEAREFVFPRAAESELASQWLGGREREAVEIDQLRIQGGIPAVPADIGPTELPNEGGLEKEAISFTKGCYLGQEVMARLKSMGQVRRRLLRLRGTGEPPARGTALHQAGRRIGEMKTAVRVGDGFIGFGLMTVLGLRVEEPVTVATDGAGESICVERHE
jgi:folate-binding protein YgfZ